MWRGYTQISWGGNDIFSNIFTIVEVEFSAVVFVHARRDQAVVAWSRACGESARRLVRHVNDAPLAVVYMYNITSHS